MSLEERVESVRKGVEALEARLKEQADYKRMYEELKGETESRLTKEEALTSTLRAQVESLQEELTRLSKVVNDYQQEIESLHKRHEEEKVVWLEKSSEANASHLALKNLLRPIATELLEEQFQDAVKKATETLQVQTQPYTMTKTVGDFTVELPRQPLTLDVKTTRGRILYLITDGFFNKPTTVPKIIKELRDQFIEVKREEVEPELVFFVQEEVLHHTVLATGAHVYQLRAHAKDRVRKVVREAQV